MWGNKLYKKPIFLRGKGSRAKRKQIAKRLKYINFS